MFKFLWNKIYNKNGRNVKIIIESKKGFIIILWLRKKEIDGRIFYKVKDCINAGFIKKDYNLLFETISLREGSFDKLLVHVLNERFMAISWYHKFLNVEIEFY